MLVFSVVFCSQAFLELPTGILSDYVGRKKILILGALSAAIAMLLYAFGFNFWWLLVGAIFEGLSRSLYSGTAKALLYETLKEQGQEDSFESVLGKTNAMYQIALCISAALGGLLALVSLSAVLWASVVPQVLCFLVTFMFIEPKFIERSSEKAITLLKDSFSQILKNHKLRMVSLAEIMDFGFGEAIFYFQAAFYKMVIPEWLIGIVRSINHLFSAISFWYSGSIINQLGYKKTLIGGNIISTILGYVALIFPSFVSPFLMCAMALTFGPSDTARSGIMHREFSDHQRSTMDSIVSFGGSLFFAAASAALGFMADITSPIYAMMIGLSSNILIVLVYMRMFKDLKE